MSEFWRGFCICAIYYQLIQDLMGKELYLKVASSLWMNTHWSFWAVLLILFLSVPLINKQLNRKGK